MFLSPSSSFPPTMEGFDVVDSAKIITDVQSAKYSDDYLLCI